MSYRGRIGRLVAVLPLVLSIGFVACGGQAPPSSTAPSLILRLPFDSSLPVRLSGVVRDYSGQAVSGAKVSLNTSDVRPAFTDAAGHYAFPRFPAPGKVLEVRAEAEGFYDDARSLFVGPDSIQDLEVMPPLTVRAGGTVTADLHAGPHNSICSVFQVDNKPSDTCRAVLVHLDRPGTLKASLDWPRSSGLALSQLRAVFDLPGYGPTVCCAPGMVLSLPISTQRGVTLLVRLREPSIAPVTFTLHTSEDP
jgi:hypothetical protein